MNQNLYSRRNFLEKGLLASALAAALPGLAFAGEDPKDAKPKTAKAVVKTAKTKTDVNPTFKESPSLDLPTTAKAEPLSNGEKVVLLVGSHHNGAIEQHVRKLLEGKACVFTPSVNCGNSLDVLRSLPNWIKEFDPDVIHIGTGHEDIRTVFYGSYDNMVPRAFYKRNVRQILDFVYGLSEKAVPIWATSTPVQDEWLAEEKSRVRDWTFFTDDVASYNKEAIKVCRKMNVKVNDLFSVMQYSGVESLVHKNGYDLNSKGITAVGQAVASHIEQYL